MDEDALPASQVADITDILQKAERGTPVFKEYEEEDEEEEVVADETIDTTGETANLMMAPPKVGLYYYHPDHLGSSTYLTDASGLLYQFYLNLPFGETMAEQHSLTEDYETPYKFNGKELDTDTGYYYYGARYYEPRISIWLSVDPLAEKYHGHNPYVYCYQNPINFIDPTGMEGEDTSGGGIDPPVRKRLQQLAQSQGVGLYNDPGNMGGELPEIVINGTVTKKMVSNNNSSSGAAVATTVATIESSSSGAAALRLLASIVLRASVVVGTATLLEGDTRKDKYEFFYRAMSMEEYNSTQGYLQDRNSSGEGPHVRTDFSYIDNANFINHPKSKYDVVVQYKVSIENATLIKSTPLIYVPGSGPGAAIFNAARASGMPYQKIEKGVSYGFPGGKATALFNASIIGRPVLFSNIKK